MDFGIHFARSGMSFRVACAAAALVMVAPLFVSQGRADEAYSGPSFRKGLWHFVRTLDVVRNANRNVKYRMMQREMTRCVDPTQAMKATFASPPVGACISDKPEKVDNKYTFGNRCDYMGAVHTEITVNSEEAYTEVNEVRAGEHPKTDKVVARRIGDCQDDVAQSARALIEH